MPGRHLLLLSGLVLLGCHGASETEPLPRAAEDPAQPLPVELHLMSKCPFGNAMLQALLPAAEALDGRVELRVRHLGRVEDGQLVSDRGVGEVQADKLQLCAELQGDERADARAVRRFLACMSARYLELPAGAEQCATEAGLDGEALQTCAGGLQGTELLARSFASSQQRDIQASPTLLIDGREHGGARTTTALTRALCDALPPPSPDVCLQLPPPVELSVTFVTDSRCPAELCDTGGVEALVARTSEVAHVRTLDVSSPEGRALYAASGHHTLPIAVFDESIRELPSLASHFKLKMRALDELPGLAYRIGKHWDPDAEICDDGQDNTADGLIDCADPACVERVGCRAAQPRKLELFVMSKCPYGARAVAAADALLSSFGRERAQVDFTLSFAGSPSGPGEPLRSLRGEPELAEDRRQLCAQAHYGQDHAFLDYVLCRNRDQASDEWRACATGAIDADVLQACADGDEGQRLLEDSFSRARRLQVRHSPWGMVNDSVELEGFGPQQMQRALCEHNPGHDACGGIGG